MSAILGYAHPRMTETFSAQAARGVQLLLDVCSQVAIGHYDDQALKACDRGRQGRIGGFHLGQALGPIGTGMRPGNQNGSLRFPFRRQAQGRVGHGALVT